MRNPAQKELLNTGTFDYVVGSAYVPDERSANSHQKPKVPEIDGSANSSAPPADKLTPLGGVKSNLEKPLLGEAIGMLTADSQQIHVPPAVKVSEQPSKTLAEEVPRSEGDDAKLENRLSPETQESAVDSPRSPQLSEREVFDKLSKTLADHAPKLTGDEKQREKDLRQQVARALAKYTTGNSDSGCLLVEYRTVYKSKGKWVEVAKELGKVINRSDRTIFRMIDEYKASLEPPKLEVEIDRTEIDGLKLSTQEKTERDARLAIRVSLNNISREKKQGVLEALLGEEAYQVWNKREPFELTVTPTLSRFTVDGRKRAPQVPAEEKTA